MGAVLGATLALLGLLAGGCAKITARSPWDEEDLQPPPGFLPPPVRALAPIPFHERLDFVRGFWPLEFGPDGKTWRWMGAHGEIQLQNDHRPQRLRLLGWLPLEYLTGPPTIRVSLGKHLVDTFIGSAHGLDREYLVEPGWLGDGPTVTLAIDTSATTRAPGDARELGVSIESVTWRDAPAPPTVP
jgi:hypothetical protein